MRERTALHSELTGALVGGTTATAIDTNDASIHDRNLIIPIVLMVILVILDAAIALDSRADSADLDHRAVIRHRAGVAAVVFNGVFQFPGADPAVPLYGFVFLVALGIDYNIFMIRVREESLEHGTRDGIRWASRSPAG